MIENYINGKIREAYYYMQNDSENALKIFDEILEIEPENIEAINGKGSTLMKLNKLDKAEICFNHSLSLQENPSAFLNKGNICKHRNNLDKAFQYYDKACELNPNLKSIVNILKNEVATNETYLNGFNEQANELIEKGIKLKNENKLWDSFETLMEAIAADRTCKKHVNELIDDILIIIEKEFKYDDYKFDINNKIDRLKIQALRAFNEENNPKKALTLFNLILEINKNDINTLNHKGGVLFICKKYKKSIECFDKCLNINKNYYCSLFNKALVLRLMNKLPESLNCFEELLKMQENNTEYEAYKMEIIEKLHHEP